MPPPLALLVLAVPLFQATAVQLNHTGRDIRALDPSPGGCVHEGRWHAAGAPVRTREPCLRCACAGGALSCRRRACAPLPDPPPRRCHVLHRKGACCPELHCPDGVKLMELGASARFEDEDYSDLSSPTSVGHACVEGGTVFGAGSALAPGAACEQCFCLGGARRCVRPRCLPPPPGCVARPAPGACCPQRYYCDHSVPSTHGTHDCEVDGAWFTEGERVPPAEKRSSCSQCFCLRGAVRCQPLACAPALHGCAPLLRAGECCAHQYRCEHSAKPHQLTHNSLISVRNDDRSLHTSKSTKQETSTTSVSTSAATKTNPPLTPATKKMPVATAKVKRKTDESSPSSTSHQPAKNVTSTTVEAAQSVTVDSSTEKLLRSNFETSTFEHSPETTSTEQPEGSVRIMINGTINCTAELSSTSLPLNLTTNVTERVKMEVRPRIPIMTTVDIESQTFNPNDIITDRSVNGDFDEDEMFTINVTSSLSTNTTRVTPGPAMVTVSKVSAPTDLPSILNITKKTNEFDFDYAEPTLPPSLPNLKIIPFVAADAVLDDDDEAPKAEITYPILEREDKYPVYYPTSEAKVTPFASRRHDVYQPTQYPVFPSEKVETSHYPTLSHEIDITSSDYPSATNDLLDEHSVATAIGSQLSQVLEYNKAVTNIPSSSTTFRLETPSVNLFSPPVETEGGFMPKGPGGIIDEYYAVYPSTPSGPSVPHLTTSMQLDTVKECISTEGHRVREGESVSVSCSVCTCVWGELRCAARACPAPAPCRRRAAAAGQCCGDLVCDSEKHATITSSTTTEKSFINTNDSSYDNATATESKVMTIDTEPKLENGTKIENVDLLEEVMTDNTSAIQNNHKNNNGTVKLTTSHQTHNSAPVTSMISTTLSATTTTTTSTTAAIPDQKETNETNYQTPDYEEEEEDEGFSFGSVLKLLLSESYDSTTAAPFKRRPTTAVTRPATTRVTTTAPPPTTTRRLPKPSIAPFVPIPHYPYLPPKKTFQQNTVNRIDHLVLGEATAIKKTTSRPAISPFKPVPVTYRPVTTQKPLFTTRTTTTRKEIQTTQTPVSLEEQRPLVPNVLPGVGGLLKLAGCNIYGRMYRVGRIIAELSTPCQECRCTELGVQCQPLAC